MPATLRRLSPKQERFVAEYIATGNATEAYRRAYPISVTWTQNALNVEASRMLDHPMLLLRISELEEDAAEAAKVSATWILSRLVAEATGTSPNTSAQSRIRALELLAKYLGLPTERSEQRMAGGITVVVQGNHGLRQS